jgi:hypothetical protein
MFSSPLAALFNSLFIFYILLLWFHSFFFSLSCPKALTTISIFLRDISPPRLCQVLGFVLSCAMLVVSEKEAKLDPLVVFKMNFSFILGEVKVD